MKHKNILYRILMFIGIFCLSIGSASAIDSFPSSFTSSSEGVSLTYVFSNGTPVFSTSQSVSDTHDFPYFHIKNSSSGNIICVSGLGVNEPSSGLTYTTASWSSTSQAKGVAYIINTIIGTGGSASVSNEKYYWAEVLINDYLGTYTPNDGSYIDYYFISAGKEIAGTGKTYNEILSGAQSYASKDFSASVSASKTSLSFTNGGDGYYYSDTITITSSGSISFGTISNSKFSYEKTGTNTYRFKIKASDITGTQSFSINVNSTGTTYYTAQRYETSGSYQDVTLAQTKANTESSSVAISGSVTANGKITINKYAADGTTHLSGATIKITGPNNYSKTITTTGKAYVLENLELGTYTITETAAPSGYVLDTTEHTVTLSATKTSDSVSITNRTARLGIIKRDKQTLDVIAGATLQLQDKDGTVIEEWVTTRTVHVINDLKPGTYYVVEKKAPSGYVLNTEKLEIVMNGSEDVTKIFYNTSTRLSILKVDKETGVPLAGAKLQLQDKSGNAITDADGNAYEWTTTEEPYVIKGLAAGTYYLKEIQPPSGYALDDNRKKITITQSEELHEVKFENTKAKLSILKIDSKTGKPLAGAKLQLQDKSGNVITDADGNPYEWTTTEEPYVIVGLKRDFYYLAEIEAPEGYILNTERIRIVFAGFEEVMEIKMENDLTRVEITKISTANGQPLKGATLQIQDADGNVIKDADGNPYEWVSTEEAFVIEGLTAGTYYLVELSAPEGYVLNTEKVPFTVDKETSVIEVEMKNNLDVDVQDTLSTRSALLLTIAMFDIALGIGILTYVKKTKTQE